MVRFMGNALEIVEVKVNAGKKYQEIDGFGVNINSRYWDNGKLIPVMDLLIEDLGATLYRVDIYGKSNWVDPASKKDASVLNESNYEEIYTNEVFRNGLAMARYLNKKGIEPYITASGDVPRWMLAKDGKTLAQYEQFAEMMASFIDRAKNREKIKFKYFGPLNETDLGSPEGPTVSPDDYVKVIEVLDNKFKSRKLNDIRLVVAEQAMFNTDYISKLFKNKKIINRLGVIGMHCYGEISKKEFSKFIKEVESGPCKDCRLWMTEYGDLDQSGEREWYVAWVSTVRLLNLLEAGFNGALVWDAYDNYHDHDGAWTIYGLIRNARRIYTPKKRYYAAKQVYRYVLPGFERVEVKFDVDDLKILGFADSKKTQITLVGINNASRDIYINCKLEGFDERILKDKAAYYRTSESENCAKIEELGVTGPNYPFDGLAVQIPAYSIFTLTNAKF